MVKDSSSDFSCCFSKFTIFLYDLFTTYKIPSDIKLFDIGFGLYLSIKFLSIHCVLSQIIPLLKSFELKEK